MPDAAVDCAGFQSGPFGPLISTLRDEAGLGFPLESPPSVFQYFSSGQEFDYVVFLCNTSLVDLCELFQQDVDTLFGDGEKLVRWVVAPFSDLQGNDRQRLDGARAIVEDIRTKVKRLAVQIETGTVEDQIPPGCGPSAQA